MSFCSGDFRCAGPVRRRRLSVCCPYQLRVRRREDLFSLRKIRPQAGCHKKESQSILLCNRQDQIVPEEYTTYFRSVIAFGTIRILEDDHEKMDAIEKLAVKYAPEDTPESRKNTIEREWTPLCMLEMTIDHLTGKEAKELKRNSSGRP